MKKGIAWLALAAALACTQSPPTDETASITGGVNDPSLLLGRWRLVEVQGQQVITTGVREPHLIFSRDSVDRVSGQTGCNHLGGRFSAEGERIQFSEMFSTRAACAQDEGNHQETRFFAALREADRYAIRGETLTLRAGERPVAKLVKEQ